MYGIFENVSRFSLKSRGVNKNKLAIFLTSPKKHKKFFNSRNLSSQYIYSSLYLLTSSIYYFFNVKLDARRKSQLTKTST